MNLTILGDLLTPKHLSFLTYKIRVLTRSTSDAWRAVTAVFAAEKVLHTYQLWLSIPVAPRTVSSNGRVASQIVDVPPFMESVTGSSGCARFCSAKAALNCLVSSCWGTGPCTSWARSPKVRISTCSGGMHVAACLCPAVVPTVCEGAHFLVPSLAPDVSSHLSSSHSGSES